MPFLLSLFLLLYSCAELPHILPPELSGKMNAPEIRDSCRNLFPRHPLRLLHSIEARTPGGKKQFMTGLTLLSPETEQFRSVMMSVEGLVIFDAVYDKGEMRIHRGIPPFDSEKFARGVLNDVRLMFLLPSGKCTEAGIREKGMPICRYENGENIFIDVEISETGDAVIRQYVRKKLRRTVRMAGVNADAEGEMPPKESRLLFHGAVGYELQLHLLESETIPENEFQQLLAVFCQG
ncbi:MAG: hypothetical protein V2I97_02495 [Desulfococcaceae bacterium]|jgi:hypothetical protein|nr:hypothetical protein [Desulfococcaceae bacterium]